MNERFRNRTDAGRQLATGLSDYAGRADVRVLALPRGGVPVAYEVACALDAPLDVFLVRKLGLPGNEELAMGAIASGGVMVLNQELVHTLNVSAAAIDAVVQTEMRELERRDRRYRDDRPAQDIAGCTAIVVDDGLATGSTMQAAVAALKQEHPKAVVVAVPVAAPEICAAFRREVDDVVCVLRPEPFHAVGSWYDDFSQTTDEEVHQLLAAARDCIHTNTNTNTGLTPMRRYNESR
ncbi:MAG: phosphoribosyltransferase [Gemmatimonadaceae bacterium]